jgi:hypothetical protein
MTDYLIYTIFYFPTGVVDSLELTYNNFKVTKIGKYKGDSSLRQTFTCSGLASFGMTGQVHRDEGRSGEPRNRAMKYDGFRLRGSPLLHMYLPLMTCHSER